MTLSDEDKLYKLKETTVITDISAQLKTNPTDYGNPTGGCKSDEISGGIEGDDGVTCLPECTKTSKCPQDVPEGTTATPVCAVMDFKHGKAYCILQCKGIHKGKCPEGTSCRKVPNSAAVCLYENGEPVLIEEDK